MNTTQQCQTCTVSIESHGPPLCAGCAWKEIERLQAELAASVGRYESRWHKYRTLEKELEQAKSEVDLANALMRPTELTLKVVEDQLKQAHEQIADDVAACIDFQDQLNAALGEAREAKERERQLREDLSQPNQNVFVPSVTTSGTGSEAERINKARHGLCTNDYHNRYIGDLESANARLQHEVEEARGHVLSERDKSRKEIARLTSDVISFSGIADTLKNENARLTDEVKYQQRVTDAVKDRLHYSVQDSARLRETLTKLDEVVAQSDNLPSCSEVYLHRIIRAALQKPKEQA